MIKGVEQTVVPYVLEDDRANPVSEQTIFWIKPKTGHDQNKTVQRYAPAFKENRKGGREVNPIKMDIADQEEFIYVVRKVENYGFPESNSMFKDFDKGILVSSDDPNVLKEVARTLSADHLSEILEVSNNMSKLTEGAKKNSSS